MAGGRVRGLSYIVVVALFLVSALFGYRAVFVNTQNEENCGPYELDQDNNESPQQSW